MPQQRGSVYGHVVLMNAMNGSRIYKSVWLKLGVNINQGRVRRMVTLNAGVNTLIQVVIVVKKIMIVVPGLALRLLLGEEIEAGIVQQEDRANPTATATADHQKRHKEEIGEIGERDAPVPVEGIESALAPEEEIENALAPEGEIENVRVPEMEGVLVLVD